jgi:hypothetical protein
MIRTQPWGCLFTLLLSLATLAGGILPGCSDDSGPYQRYDFAGPDLGQSIEAGVDSAVDLVSLDQTADAQGDLGSDISGADLTPDLQLADQGPDGPPPPAHSSCSTPKSVSLSAGKASITDDTTTAKDEHPTVDCGNPLGPWPGRQLYYKLPLSAGKAYRVTLTPSGSAGFDAALYAFPAATACQASVINAACTGNAVDTVGSTAEILVIKPGASADWIIVVDAYDKAQFGPFSLVVEELTAPANTTCAAAQSVSLVSGKASVQGDTTLSTDEFSKLTCSGADGPWPGPQLYYTLAGLVAGKHYKVVLIPAGFDGALYAFAAATTCSEAGIGAACAGHVSDASTSGPETLLLSPTSTGDWKIAVDAALANGAGTFTLEVSEVTLPNNTTCAKAQAVTLTAGAAQVTADTSLSTDEYAGLTCGGVAALTGPQLYYTVALTAGQPYVLALSAAFNARLYVAAAPASCSETAIETACKSNGGSGDLLATFAQTPTDLLFTPQTSGSYLVGVDSSGAGGAFTLALSELTVPTFMAPLAFNFDSDCKGLAATNDWACGTLAFSAGAACTAAAKGPTAGHSGSGAWGTVLNDCHSPLGNNAGYLGCSNAAPNDDSILSFKVSLPGGWTKATLTYWAWEDLNIPNDWAEIRVSGSAVSAGQVCAGTPTSPTAWIQRTVDLTAHVGKTVQISFHMLASPVTNRAGWYIDDLAVSGS